ncbi:hypothetical protein Droror1_Dr00000276 [Drosera rotundifolia]
MVAVDYLSVVMTCIVFVIYPMNFLGSLALPLFFFLLPWYFFFPLGIVFFSNFDKDYLRNVVQLSERLFKNVVRVHRQEEADLFYIPFFTTISFFPLERQQCKALYKRLLT